METILWFLGLAWKILAIGLGWKLFKYVVKNGPGVIVEFLHSAKILMKAGLVWLLYKIFGKRLPDTEESGDTLKVEGTIK